MGWRQGGDAGTCCVDGGYPTDIPLRHCPARKVSLLLFYFIRKQYVILPFFLTSLFMTMTSVL